MLQHHPCTNSLITTTHQLILSYFLFPILSPIFPIILMINLPLFITMSWLFKGFGSKKKEEPPKAETQKPKKDDESSDEESNQQIKNLDIDKLVVQESKQQPISDFSKDYEGYVSPSPQQLENMWKAFKCFPNDPNDDEPRHQLAYKKGGKLCGDQQQVDKIRSIGKEMVKKIGKDFLNGQMNLTKISFPIKLMVPKTVLENSTMGCSMFPIYINRAAESTDPLERMKLFVTAIISSFYYMNMFTKPLNPILGETLEGSYPDGSRIYCEQISHHPPISYFLLVGPEEKYRYYGYYLIEAKAGWNSLTLLNNGTRTLEFPNGDKIKVNFPKEVFQSGLFGNLRSVTYGQMKFKDERNKIESSVVFGEVKKRPTDYFQGKITKNGKVVDSITGSYLGYLNIGAERYFDGRYLSAIKIDIDESRLESDHRKRGDLILLAKTQISEAQAEKERLEDLQRGDKKLREAGEKARNAKSKENSK